MYSVKLNAKSCKIFVVAVSCLITAASSYAESKVVRSDFDEIELFTLKNKQGMVVKLTNYGATVTSLLVPDRNGQFGDVALGYASVEGYMNAIDRPYFGSIVGRYGNRIAKGQFELDGETYELATNNDLNHLHGGNIGFDKVVWESEVVEGELPGVTFSYTAKDGEEGYPGNLAVKVTYLLTDENELQISYHAETDKATPVNLTNHTYFNLASEGQGTILGHQLQLEAEQFTPIDETLIPTGELMAVKGTPFDFTQSKAIGKEIGAKDEQLKFGLGYDHNFVLSSEADENGMRLAATVYEPKSGRVMEVFTQEPGIQFYSGNFLDGRLKGKSGQAYLYRGGFCLETQHFPDSPNQSAFPTTILRPGETYQTKTSYRFSARK